MIAETLNITREDARLTAYKPTRFAVLTPDASPDLAQHPRAAGDRPAQQSPEPGRLHHPRRQHRLPADACIVQRGRAGCFVALGLLLACAACKPAKDPKQSCSTQTKCSAGYKCEKEDSGGHVSGPLDVGKCEKDPCAVTVPCEKPQHSTHPQEPCVNDLVEACDLHDPNKFCKCVSTLPNEGHVTTGNTPTTG